MSNKNRQNHKCPFPKATQQKKVNSLWDAIVPGREYGSIIGVQPRDGLDLVSELVRGLKEIEAIRKRPCIGYLGNVVNQGIIGAGVDPADDLPFSEMVATIPQELQEVDVLLSTWGGSAHQISQFVNCLRSRFSTVNFIIPSYCMSAGTLFALSGNNIIMTSRACLGPIDPQVPKQDGNYVPAQALLLLVQDLQKKGEAAIQQGKPVPWSFVRILDSLDKKELGYAITATQYSITMATEFLVNYKFRDWATRKTSQLPVDDSYRRERADSIANALASHDRWKSHGHAISREVLWSEIELEIEHPDVDFNNLIVKLWALLSWIFDKASVAKLIVSSNYSFVRSVPPRVNA